MSYTWYTYQEFSSAFHLSPVKCAPRFNAHFSSPWELLNYLVHFNCTFPLIKSEGRWDVVFTQLSSTTINEFSREMTANHIN